jgi:hypothetical protein
MCYLFFACETGNTQVLIRGSATATSGTDALVFLPTAALATSPTTTTLPTAPVALNEVTTPVPAAVDFHDTPKHDKGFSFVCYRPSYRESLCSTDTDTCIGIGRIRIRGYGNFLKNPIHGYVYYLKNKIKNNSAY